MVVVLYDANEEVVAVKVLDVNGNLKELYVHCTYDPLKTYDEIEAEGGNLGKFLKELTKRGGLKKTWIPKLVG